MSTIPIGVHLNDQLEEVVVVVKGVAGAALEAAGRIFEASLWVGLAFLSKFDQL